MAETQKSSVTGRGTEDFDPQAVAEIRSRLQAVHHDGIRIGFAIESGSRAWGFPSPDSDYDCRFVYVRPLNDHLSLRAARDVIEFPIVGDIDTGGWDLKKALLLALKGNAVLVEWLKSPIVYEEEAGFRDRLGTLLDEIMVPGKVARHYVGLFRQQWTPQEGAPIRLKKLLYALRPAIALEWMRQRSFAALPPMNMMECLEATELDPSLRQTIIELVELKKQTREMGEGKPPAHIERFLGDISERYRDLSLPNQRDKDQETAAHHLADKFYLQEVLSRKG
ncbi:nucleotidyltransferase domain-containing protein [Rhizobium sp. 16-449-1b]|uniref:nucleotidyltransferase domain-containing protein n=1 Tax=Rhizobium sp. 16-449-1b TaxID=2819989 RepID=UPI001FFE2454|nr:nucleotidyltransferase domain-containing protein [Rhizobium sp. 16-449-1b]